MNFENYKTAFKHKATEAGYSFDNLMKCLVYAEKLFANNVPVIYNTTHLAALVGYEKHYIKRAIAHTQFFYAKYKIRKNNGGIRTISEPLPGLKEIQLWILENILYKIPISKYAKAYVPKMNFKQNLYFHKKQPKVLCLDLENFFPSITFNYVEQIFRSIGYSNVVSNLLAKLCCLNGNLPQGAPTSPYLSNIFMNPIDDIISNYCKENKIRFTRYADDLTFSGEFDQTAIIELVQNTISNFNLKLRPEKTKLMTQSMRQVVTGIVVNEKLQVQFRKRNKLRQEIYYIKKFGLQSHVQRKQITKGNYLLHLLGQVNYILLINPEDMEFLEYKKYLNSLIYIPEKNLDL